MVGRALVVIGLLVSGIGALVWLGRLCVSPWWYDGLLSSSDLDHCECSSNGSGEFDSPLMRLIL